MFSAAVGGFNYYTAPISSTGRITILVDSTYDIQTSTNPYTPVIDSSYNLYVTYQYYTGGLESTVLFKVNSSGVLQYQRRIYNASASRRGSAISVDSNTSQQYMNILAGSSVAGQSWYRVSNTGTTLTSSVYGYGPGFAQGYELAAFTVVDTTNSCVYYVFNRDYQGYASSAIARTTSLTTMVPTSSCYSYPTSGQPNYEYGCLSGSRLLIAGRNLDTDFKGMIGSYAAPITSGASGTAYIASKTGSSLEYYRIIGNGTTVYAGGYVTNPVSGTIETAFLIKYTQSGSTLTYAWDKTFAAIATNSSIKAMAFATSGNIIVAINNNSTVTSIICLDSSGNIVWQNKITLTSASATRCNPTQISTSSTDFYLYCDLTITGSYISGAYFQLPLDGSIPGSGSYTVGGKSFTYTSESKSFVSNTVTTSTSGLSGGTRTYYNTTLAITNGVFANDSATTGTI